MRRAFSLAAICFSLLLATTVAQAQKINYLSSTFMKVEPDKEAQFNKMLRADFEKIVREAFASGTNATGVNITRVMYSGVPAEAYNYVQTITMEGSPQDVNPAVRDQWYKKGAGMSYEDYMQKLGSVSTVVGTSLARTEASTPGLAVKEGNVLQVTGYKLTSQRIGEYGDFIQKVELPLRTQLMKDGANAGWAAYRVVSPTGAAMSVFIPNDSSSAAKSTPSSRRSPRNSDSSKAASLATRSTTRSKPRCPISPT